MGDLEAQDKIDETSKLNVEEKAENDCYNKEELEVLSNTPCWNNTRRVLLGLFWLCWIGMIAWSVIIVINAPKCKKEPQQAWFTKGAIANFDCSIDLEEIKTTLGEVEPGQFIGVIADGCTPALSELASAEEDQRAKAEEMKSIATRKNFKMLFSVNADDSEFADWETLFSSSFAGDGIILRDSKLENPAAIDISGFLGEGGIFFEGTEEIPENAFYFKSLGDDGLTEARDWLDKTLNKTTEIENVDIPVWEIDAGTETLWKADNEKSDNVLMSSILPGGFVLPFSANNVDPIYSTFGEDVGKWRSEYQSLRAITGSTIRWFTDNTGFSRKFDMQPAVEIVINYGAEDLELSSVRGPLDPTKRTIIYPEEQDPVIKPGNGQVFVTN